MHESRDPHPGKRIKKSVGQFRLLLQNRWFRLTAQIIVVTLSLIYLWNNFQSARVILNETHINYRPLVIAWVLTVIAVFLGAFGWRHTLRGLGLDAPWKEAVHIHLTSNLAKYIPGFAWQLVGKAVMTRQTGVPALEVGVAMTLELVQLVVLGLILMVACFPSVLIESWTTSKPLIDYLVIIKLIVIVGLVSIMYFLLLKFNSVSRAHGRIFLKINSLVISGLLILFGWLLFGFAFWLMGVALLPISWETIPLFVFTLTASILIGLAIIFIPGSIGIRESLMVFFLTGAGMLPPLAVVVAIFSRVIVIISELTGYLLFLIYAKKPSPNKNVRENGQNSPKEVL